MRGIHRAYRVYRGLQEYIEAYKSIQGIIGIQRYTGVYRGYEGYTEVYKSI